MTIEELEEKQKKMIQEKNDFLDIFVPSRKPLLDNFYQMEEFKMTENSYFGYYAPCSFGIKIPVGYIQEFTLSQETNFHIHIISEYQRMGFGTNFLAEYANKKIRQDNLLRYIVDTDAGKNLLYSLNEKYKKYFFIVKNKVYNNHFIILHKKNKEYNKIKIEAMKKEGSFGDII